MKITTSLRSSNIQSSILIGILAFSLANLRGTVFWSLLKQGFQITALPWIEVFLWVALGILTAQALIQADLLQSYASAWKKNWILLPFMIIAVLSLLWTISISATLYKLAALMFSSLVGAYLGSRYSIAGLLNVLFRFGSLLLILCFVLAVFLPILGAMMYEPYNGAWRGVFWHKNQFGGVAALFSMVFLIRLLDAIGKANGKPIVDLVFYLFAGVNVFFSKSVAGYLLFILMTFIVLLVFIWLRIRRYLKPIHYYGAFGIGSAALLLIVFNLDLIFGLFNRDTSLTGRIPLWNYLIRDIVGQRPWLGYGLGAIWSFASFRIAIQQVVGWGFPVAIADNGFLDILLHVGVIGLIFFVLILLTVFARSYRYAFQHLSLPAFFPLLLLIFVFFANLTFSFFLETETFIWMLIVAVLFSLTKPGQPTAG